MASIDEVQATLEEIMMRLRAMEERRLASDMVEITEGLSDVSHDLGLQKAGEVRFGRGTPGKGDGFSGLRIANKGMSYGDATYIMAAVTEDELQWGVEDDGTAQGGIAGMQELTDGANIAWDLDGGNGYVTLEGDRILDTPSNGTTGHYYILKVTQDGTGGRTLAFGTDYLFTHGARPALSTTAAQVDILTFFFDGTNMHHIDSRLHMTDEFDPNNDISSTLLCWLDANQITGKAHLDTITTWSDMSVGGTDHTITTAGSPVYRTNAVNGYPVVRFEGANVSATFAPGPWALPQNNTIVLVWKQVDRHGDYTRGMQGSGAWVLDANRWKPTTYGPTFYRGAHNYATDPGLGNFILHYLEDDDGALGLHRVNGVDIQTTLSGTAEAGYLFIGPHTGANNTTEPCNHDFAELLIFDGDLSGADQTALEAYLNGKYAIY